MFVKSLLLVSASLVAASDCEDTHINKRGMIQCVMRGVDAAPKAPALPASAVNGAPNTSPHTQAASSPAQGAQGPAQGPAQAPAQSSSQFGAPAQANDAKKATVEIGLGVALAMCLLL